MKWCIRISTFLEKNGYWLTELVIKLPVGKGNVYTVTYVVGNEELGKSDYACRKHAAD